jgi:hypothetical protein
LSSADVLLQKLAGGFWGKNEPSQAVACQLIDQFLRIPHVGPAGFALIHLFSFIGGVERNSDVGDIEYNPPGSSEAACSTSGRCLRVPVLGLF